MSLAINGEGEELFGSLSVLGERLSKDLTPRGWVVSTVVWVMLSMAIFFLALERIPRQLDTYVTLPLFMASLCIGAVASSLIFGWFEHPWRGIVVTIKSGLITVLITMAIIWMFALAAIGDG